LLGIHAWLSIHINIGFRGKQAHPMQALCASLVPSQRFLKLLGLKFLVAIIATVSFNPRKHIEGWPDEIKNIIHGLLSLRFKKGELVRLDHGRGSLLGRRCSPISFI
jgi:hypothetical protein